MKLPHGNQICGAHARTTGKPCQKPPMANGRCRNHGGLSTGRPIKSGLYTKAAIEQRRKFRKLIRQLNELSASLRTGQIKNTAPGADFSKEPK